jgi:triacylglycerol lipase
MYRIVLQILLQFAFMSASASYKIYVIHGYGAPKFLMNKITKSLKNDNYLSLNFGYKSIKEDLETISKKLYQEIKNSGVDTVSFVTHSMGALVVRSMLNYSLNDPDFPKIFRIVMIAPPNKGAEIADIYSSFKFLKFLFGPNLQKMKTDSNSFACGLPVPLEAEIGIIVGIRGKKHGYNPFIKGDNDGRLTPGKAKLGLEKDFVPVKGRHTMLTQKKTVRKLVLEFMESGNFVSKDPKLIRANN